MSKIGICDWGIGGLGTVKAIRETLNSSVDIVYYSDSGYTPYGKVPEAELRKRWLEVQEFFRHESVELIIVACNALSTVVKSGEAVTIASAVSKMLEKMKNARVGVIGGERTIKSKIYDYGFEGHRFQIAQPLSALVERGVVKGNEVEMVIRRVIDSIRPVDHIVLACTHYPVLIEVMNSLYPDMEFLDPVNSLIADLDFCLEGEGKTKYFTSGSASQFIESTRKAFNVKVDFVEEVSW